MRRVRRKDVIRQPQYMCGRGRLVRVPRDTVEWAGNWPRFGFPARVGAAHSESYHKDAAGLYPRGARVVQNARNLDHASAAAAGSCARGRASLKNPCRAPG